MATFEIVYRCDDGASPARPPPADAAEARARLNEGNRAFASLLDPAARRGARRGEPGRADRPFAHQKRDRRIPAGSVCRGARLRRCAGADRARVDRTGQPEYPLSLDLMFAVSVILTAAGAAMLLAATAVYVRLLLT
jgi:hypothetical protein